MKTTTPIELIVRALIELGNATGYRAIDLVLDLDSDCGDVDIMARTREIIEDGFGHPMTDSTVDDLCEVIDDGVAGDHD